MRQGDLHADRRFELRVNRNPLIVTLSRNGIFVEFCLVEEYLVAKQNNVLATELLRYLFRRLAVVVAFTPNQLNVKHTRLVRIEIAVDVHLFRVYAQELLLVIIQNILVPCGEGKEVI